MQDFDGVNLQAAAWDFGTIGVNESASHPFIVSNSGGATANGLSALAIGTGFGYLGGSYPGTGGNCSTSLAGSGSCTIVVAFQPTAPGLATGSVALTYQDGGGNSFSASRVVRGIGTNLGLVQIIDSAQHGPSLVTDYGMIALGRSADHSFTVQNVGGGVVSGISFAALALPFSFPGGIPGTGGNCDVSLAIGASCTVVVRFAPGVVGNTTASLSLTYDDGSATQSVSRALAGEAVDGARLTIADWSGSSNDGGDPFDFGTWGIATTHTFYVTNSGNKPATSLAAGAIAAPFSFAGGYPGASGSCGSSLAVGATCTVVVTYSGAATAAGQVALSYGDGDGDTLTAARQLVGEAAANALLIVGDCFQCGIDNSAYNFGSTSTSATRTFFLQNTGAKTAVMVQDGAALAGAFAYAGGVGYPGAGGNCSTTLAPGAGCSLVVTFTPPGVGDFTGTVAINYDDGTGTQATATRGLLGAETNLALLTVHDYSATDNGGGDLFDYGTVGVAIDHTFTITNDGSQAATLMADGGGLGNNFAWQGSYPGKDGSCGVTLAKGAQCTVVVTFSPSGGQMSGSSFIVSYFDGANLAYATRALQGTSTAAAILQVTDSYPPPPGPNGGSNSPPPYDYGTTGAAIDHTFSITNWGGSPATMLTDGGTLGSGFGWTQNLPFGGGSCGAQLGAGASCTVSVTFTPSGNGASSSTLSIPTPTA